MLTWQAGPGLTSALEWYKSRGGLTPLYAVNGTHNRESTEDERASLSITLLSYVTPHSGVEAEAKVTDSPIDPVSTCLMWKWRRNIPSVTRLLRGTVRQRQQR